MGLDVGGYTDAPDWPKLGPSLLIATCLIVAIRTARRSAVFDTHLCDPELNQEIAFAAHLSGRVLSHLMRIEGNIFPRRNEPWYQPDGEDSPK